MRLEIDNADGAGLLEYSSAVVMSGAVTITRQHGKLTELSALLDLQGNSIPMPSLRARVFALSDAGTLLFSGYVMRTEMEGSLGKVRVVAVEDRWLTHAARDASLQPSGSTMHRISLAEVPVAFAAPVPAMASDVTLSGDHEATTFVTELFRGDGTTATFPLTLPPFHAPGAATILRDDFATPVLNTQMWSSNDPGRAMTSGAGGLNVSGGNGLDGETLLRAVNVVEMGGCITAQASGVTLQPGSDGLLLGFYSGVVTRVDCFAGLRVKGAAGAQVVVAVMNGSETGTPASYVAGHSYTFRVRLFCAEWQRVLGSYEALVGGSVRSYGGGLVSAPMQMVMEMVDEGLASNTTATVLYDGGAAVSPAQCTFAPLNAAQMQCVIGSVLLHRTGPMQVTSTRSDGSSFTRRQGVTGEGADFSFSSQGAITFFPGTVPQPGELLTVSYRRAARAVARLQDTSALAAAQQAGLPGISVWSGHMQHPPARSSADCAAAAQALLQLAADAATGIAGHCDLVNAQQTADVQPGDVLTWGNGGLQRALPIWSVAIGDENCAPEVVRYRVSFAQTQTTCLSFQTGALLASDVPLPLPAGTGSGSTVAALSGLQVVSASTSALQVDTGIDPPAGGGFEVRNADGVFGAASGSTLVMRSPVRGFSIPRSSFRERFFVRMYDGAVQPQYSACSAAVLTHLAVA